MTPKEPGFYWRRQFHHGDTAPAGWRWVPCEVYNLGGVLMTDGYAVDPVLFAWGPMMVPPLEPEYSVLEAAP